MKKYKIILVVLLLFGINASAQNIVGLWQRSSAVVGSGLGESYHFFEDGKFEFYVSQYSYLNTLVAFKGTYIVKNNEVCFIITSRIEKVNGDLKQGSLGFQDNWIIEAKETKEIAQTPTTPYCFDFALEEKGNQTVLELGNGIYYKIQDHGNLPDY